jgi:GDP-D-mannose dehydratase
MYNKKEQEMREEAKAAIIEALKDGYDGYYCDLHNEVFNTDYYIIGTYRAKEALKEYDVFEAIEKVQTYEKDNFGEIYTDMSDPEKLINMLYYIIGEEVLYEMMDGIEAWDENWNNQADEETNAAILAELDE